MTKNRKFTVIANWKMNIPSEPLSTYLQNILSITSNVDLIIAPPMHLLAMIQRMQTTNIALRNIHIAAQNVSYLQQDSGSYTGEVSAYLLSILKIKHALVAHAERRTLESLLHEGGVDTIQSRLVNCFRNGLSPIFCIGSTEREIGAVSRDLEKQLQDLFEAANKITHQNISCIIAYEPLWAICSNETPQPNELFLTSTFIRDRMKQYSKQFGREIDYVVAYGGAVNSNNVRDVFSVPSIDGILLGRSSLDSSEIKKIVSQYNVK